MFFPFLECRGAVAVSKKIQAVRESPRQVMVSPVTPGAACGDAGSWQIVDKRLCGKFRRKAEARMAAQTLVIYGGPGWTWTTDLERKVLLC